MGFLAIFAIHSFLVVDACLDMGYVINKESSACVDGNGHEQHIAFSAVMLVMYFVLGLMVSLISVLILSKVVSSENS